MEVVLVILWTILIFMLSYMYLNRLTIESNGRDYASLKPPKTCTHNIALNNKNGSKTELQELKIRVKLLEDSLSEHLIFGNHTDSENRVK